MSSCRICGAEFYGPFCPRCGAAQNENAEPPRACGESVRGRFGAFAAAKRFRGAGYSRLYEFVCYVLLQKHKDLRPREPTGILVFGTVVFFLAFSYRLGWRTCRIPCIVSF